VPCEPLMLSWFVFMVMLDLDLCNEYNDLMSSFTILFIL